MAWTAYVVVEVLTVNYEGSDHHIRGVFQMPEMAQECKARIEKEWQDADDEMKYMWDHHDVKIEAHDYQMDDYTRLATYGI
jgi:hypothetical protein